MEDVKLINKALDIQFGRALDGKPKFRVVFSEGLYEKRRGWFSHFYGHIFLRKMFGVEEVRKYNYIKERFILEAYMPQAAYTHPDEIVQSDGYEPVYTFQDKDRNYLPPNLHVAQLTCKMWLTNTSGENEKRTEKMDLIAEFEQVRQEELKYFDYLQQEEMTDMQQAFRYGQAILVHKES